MSATQKLRRPSEDATQEERRSYFTALRKALDEAAIGYGEEFMVVNPGTPEASGPAADDPSANGLGGFARDSATSRKAALDNYPRSGTQRWRVLEQIRGRGDGGYTRDELCVDLGMAPNVLTPRVKELLDGKWIETRTGFDAKTVTRTTRSGSEADVLFPAEKAQTHGT